MKIAAVQARPVWMNRAATIDKVVASIKEAASQGAKLVAFPETLVPGYPWWAAFDNVSGLDPWTRARQAVYLDQAVHIAAVTSRPRWPTPLPNGIRFRPRTG